MMMMMYYLAIKSNYLYSEGSRNFNEGIIYREIGRFKWNHKDIEVPEGRQLS